MTTSPQGLEFDRLALALFRLQFAHNRAYRKFCERRNVAPETITGWRNIPAIPTVAFKELELTSLPPEQRANVFYSSGTTTQNRSRHFHSRESLEIYETSLVAWFHHFFSVASPLSLLVLTPPANLAPNSSLVHMFETVRREFGASDSVFCGSLDADGGWKLDFAKTVGRLREAVISKRPVTVLGTAFNFVHLVDEMEKEDLRFELPAGSCVLETGGYKGRSRVVTKTELHSQIANRFGVPENRIVSEYGMSELSSQAYDLEAGAMDTRRIFHFPPWARAQIINPENGREVADGETGLIRIFDLANVYSVMAVQTEDLGVRRGGGFELVGRAALAETRGCSLMSI